MTGIVVALTGYPGAGKSTLARHAVRSTVGFCKAWRIPVPIPAGYAPSLAHLEVDAIRQALNGGKAFDEHTEAQVKHHTRVAMLALLQTHDIVLVDDAFLWRADWERFLGHKFCHETGKYVAPDYRYIRRFLATPEDEAKRRMHARAANGGRGVPTDIYQNFFHVERSDRRKLPHCDEWTTYFKVVGGTSENP